MVENVNDNAVDLVFAAKPRGSDSHEKFED